MLSTKAASASCALNQRLCWALFPVHYICANKHACVCFSTKCIPLRDIIKMSERKKKKQTNLNTFAFFFQHIFARLVFLSCFNKAICCLWMLFQCINCAGLRFPAFPGLRRLRRVRLRPRGVGSAPPWAGCRAEPVETEKTQTKGWRGSRLAWEVCLSKGIRTRKN